MVWGPTIHTQYMAERHLLCNDDVDVLFGVNSITYWRRSVYFLSITVLVVYIGALWLKEELSSLWILLPSTFLTFIGILLVSQPTFLMKLVDINGDYEPLNVYGIVCTFAAAVF
eukprot:996862_1